MRIRDYKESDCSEVSKLMKDYFLQNLEFEARSHEPDYYKWKYGKNPAGGAVVRIAEDDSKIIGYFGVILKRAWVNGSNVLAGEMVDAYLAPEYQGKGVFLKLVKEVFEECHRKGVNILVGSPNEVAKPIWLKRYKFKMAFNFRSLVMPLNFSSIINKVIKIKAISTLIGFPISLLSRIVYGGKSKYEIIQVSDFDDRTNQIWEKNKHAYSIALVKDSEYLSWRYSENPEEYEYYLVMDQGELQGLFVLKIQTLKDMTFAHIVDVLMPSNEGKVMRGLLSSISKTLRGRKVDFVSSWAQVGSQWYQSLVRKGFFSRKKHFYFVIRSENEKVELPVEIENMNIWNFAQGDTDGI